MKTLIWKFRYRYAISFLSKFLPGKKVQLEAGDFAAANAKLIEIQKPWLELEKLWRGEAEEARHPHRKLACLELANLARAYYERSVAFYSTWEIRR